MTRIFGLHHDFGVRPASRYAPLPKMEATQMSDESTTMRVNALEVSMRETAADVRELREWSREVRAYGRIITFGVPVLTAVIVALLNWAQR